MSRSTSNAPTPTPLTVQPAGGSPAAGPDAQPLRHDAPASVSPPLLSRLNPNVLPLLVTLVLFALMYAVGAVAFFDKNFLSVRTATDLLQGNAVLAVAAIGATFVILCGGIDLSVGAVVAMTTVMVASLIAAGWHPVAAWGVALIAGTALGLVMGVLIHAFDLPPFMVTLAGMFFARAMAFLIEPINLPIDSKFYVGLQDNPLPLGGRNFLALIAVVALVCYAVATLVAQFTSFGRDVYAVGGDEQSAQLLGVPIARTRIGVYAIAGFCSALAGILSTLVTSSGNPNGFVGMELDAIAAVVIGGSLISGGVGFLLGTLAGTLVAGLIQALILFQGTISSWWTKIVIGLLVLSFIVLQRLLLRLASPNTPGT